MANTFNVSTVDLPPEKVERCLFETGFGFLFAPLFHPAIKYAIGPRRDMGIRTIFNILGPITNPAGAKRQILDVFADKLTETSAMVLGDFGIRGFQDRPQHGSRSDRFRQGIKNSRR